MAIFIPNNPLAGFNVGTGSLQGPAVVLDDLTGASTSTFLIAGGAVGDQFFISASNFNVKANGNITASNALLSGTITATAGFIGGWAIGSNTLTGGNVTLNSAGEITAGTATTFTLGDGFFLSDDPFNNFRVGLAGGSRLQFTGTNIEIYDSSTRVVSLGTVNEIAGFGLTPAAISSSNTQLILRSNGQITGSNVLFTGGRIGGFTLSANAFSGANFYISGSATADQFFISASNFNVKANGNLTASSALFSGSVSVTGNINATTGNIGGFNITANAITGSGFFLSGSAANDGTSFFLSSSRFNIKGNGDVTGSQVLFTGGRIGSFVLTNNALNGVRSDTGATSFFISSSVDITSPDGLAFFISSSRFNIRQDGTVSGSNVFFNGGRIGGFTIDSSKITGTNIIIDSAGSIQTADYASDLRGWKISATDNGFAEFENVRVRGTLKTAVFEKETVNAVGGQLYVANSTTITGSEASSSIPQLVYLKFGGYSGSNAIQNIAGSGDTYLTIASLVTASIANLPTSTQTFKPIGGTGLLIASGSKTGASATNTSVASLPGITTQPSASLTIMAWVRPNFSSYTSGVPTGSILEKSGSSGVSSHGPFFIGFVVVSSTTGSLRLGSGNGTSGAGTYTAGTNALRNDTWTHIAMTVAPAGSNYNRTLYVNGILDSTNPTTVFSNTNTSPINIGVGNTFTERFPGYIADVRLYTGSLSAAQIQTIYSGSYFTSSIVSDTPALVVDNVTGFVNGEILSAKKVSNTGFATEYLQVRDTARTNPSSDVDFSGILYVTRSYGNGIAGSSGSLGDGPSSAQSYESSQVIVSTGRLGTGFIRINANPNDQATPYIDIVERTGSGIYDVALKARLGDLSGLANSNYVFGNSNPGFGLATDNVFLQGGIVANTGSIGGIRMQSNRLFTGTGTFNDNNTGFYLDNTSQFSLGNKLSWNGSVLSVSGTLNATDGTIGGFTIGANSLTATNFIVNSTAGEIELGAATSFTNGDGIYMSKANTNNFRVGDQGGARMQFTGDNLEIYNSSNTRLVSIGTLNTIAGFTISGDTLSNSTNFFISGSATGNGFFISASSFNVKANGSVTASNASISGDITANVGRFDNVSIVGSMVSSSTGYLFEAWVTSSTSLATINTNTAVRFSIPANGRFKTGRFGWTSSVDLYSRGYSASLYTANIYGAAGTRPLTFQKWGSIQNGYTADEFDLYNNTNTAEIITFPLLQTGSSQVGPSFASSIISDTISIPSTLMSSLNSVLEPITLQVPVRFHGAFGGFNYTATVTIYDSSGTALGSTTMVAAGTGQWLSFDVPLGPLLTTFGTGATVLNDFKVGIAWYRGGDSGGGSSFLGFSIGEVRILQTSRIESIRAKSVVFENGALMSNDEGVGLLGSLIPITGSTYDLGASGQTIKTIYANTVTATSINNTTIDNNAWTPYTPTWTAFTTNPTIGNGTLTGAYKQIGKTVFVRVKLAVGSTTTLGSGAWYFGLPVTASGPEAIVMPATLLNNGISWVMGTVAGEYGGFDFKTSVLAPNSTVIASASVVQGTHPFPWNSGDTLSFNGSYEAS